ncbi:hypothetical protein BDZ89DRAFT_931403, partial [Hymenopellis radicata]
YVRGSYSPKQIREKILDVNSPFRTKIIQYLESSHQAQFMKGSLNDVLQNNHSLTLSPGFKNPLIVLPTCPPPTCSKDHVNLNKLCNASEAWWEHFNSTVDFILGQLQIHECRNNKWKKCKARFPRKIFAFTTVGDDGHIDMKQLESNLNMITAVLTYCMRCNTDVTSLKSGTAIAATIHYVSEYVVKPSLKTYVIFDAIRSVF